MGIERYRGLEPTRYVAKHIAAATDAPAEWHAAIEELMRWERETGCLDDVTAEQMAALARDAWATLREMLR